MVVSNNTFNPITLNSTAGSGAINFIYNSGYSNTNYLYEIEYKVLVTESIKVTANMNPVSIHIGESAIGNVVTHQSFLKYNRFYNHTQVITVPYTNKELDITFESFRNKLIPGQAEEWKLILKDKLYHLLEKFKGQKF